MPRAAPDAHVAEEEDNGDIHPAFNEDDPQGNEGKFQIQQSRPDASF